MKIGLTYSGSKRHANYVEWLKNAGAEVVELSAQRNNAEDLETCSALVLSGGVDVHPSFYNNSVLNYPGADDFEMDRDQFEMDVFNRAQKNQLPVLGICRGLQFINCLLGGTLKQDLGELNKTHKGSPDKKHLVEIKPGSWLQQIAQTQMADVNSSHHQAIDNLGKHLKVSGIASDGTIEAIERDVAHHPFIMAVQWHPERMADFQLQDTPLSKGVRDYFINMIQNR